MPLVDELGIEKEFHRVFGLPARFAWTSTPLSLDDLLPQEQLALKEAKNRGRFHASWFLGRAVARKLFSYLEIPIEATTLMMSQNKISLSHTKNNAYAIGISEYTNGTFGIGLDVELSRTMQRDWGRFFLTPSEQQWLSNIPESSLSNTMIRLWTLKEALFKADLNNRQFDLPDYQLKDPSQWTGDAFNIHNKLAFRYYSLKLDSIWLAIATRMDAK